MAFRPWPAHRPRPLAPTRHRIPRTSRGHDRRSREIARREFLRRILDANLLQAAPRFCDGRLFEGAIDAGRPLSDPTLPNQPATCLQGDSAPPERTRRRSGNLSTMDRLSTAQRSFLMSRIRGKDTAPELIVRSVLHRLGFRFRLHRRDLPGSPDLVFPSLRKVIFVHGCFWHGHDCHRGRAQPKSNVPFWTAKLERNKSRDLNSEGKLAALGWQVAVIWECELADGLWLERVLRFLEA